MEDRFVRRELREVHTDFANVQRPRADHCRGAHVHDVDDVIAELQRADEVTAEEARSSGDECPPGRHA
jgi:hypothetical protein